MERVGKVAADLGSAFSAGSGPRPSRWPTRGSRRRSMHASWNAGDSRTAASSREHRAPPHAGAVRAARQGDCPRAGHHCPAERAGRRARPPAPPETPRGARHCRGRDALPHVADFTHDWEFWRRPDGTFEYVSPACEQVSGHVAREFLEDPTLLDGLVHEDDLPTWRTALESASGSTSAVPLEFRIRRRDGEVRWVRFASNPVRLPDGSAAGVRGSIADVTSRKLGELALERAYQEIAALKDRLEAENTYYREKIQSVEGSGELHRAERPDEVPPLPHSARSRPPRTTVLIQGETGTGKELVAEAIHTLGPRKDRPLMRSTARPCRRAWSESELFGHEKGAFTGAQAQRKGRFELADGRHALPRRGRRAASGAPGQAPARAPGRAVRAGRRTTGR